MTPHPGREPTDPPPTKPRGVAAPGIPGLRLPSLRAPRDVEITDSGGARRSGRRTVVISSGVITALAGAIVAVVQAWPASTPKPADEYHVTAEEIAAIRGEIDRVQAELTRLRERQRRLGEALCAVNGGPFGHGWDECPGGVFRESRDPPPHLRTDRVYPD